MHSPNSRANSTRHSARMMLLVWLCAIVTSGTAATPGGPQPLDVVELGRTTEDGEEKVSAAVEPGDVVLGGLFMIHQAAEGNGCGALASQMGLQALETMLYTVDVINNSTFLPGFKLGVRALDDCNQESKSLERSLDFVHRPVCENDSGVGQGQHQDKGSDSAHVVGVVGSASSLNSITVANLLKLFKIPQISYWSTSPDLSDSRRFPYFFRAVPSDQYQAQAMIDIVLHFNWTYISIVYENSNYGVQGIEEVKKLAGANDVCVAVKEMIPRDGNESVYDRIVGNLLKATDARAVILWALDESADKFFKALGRANAVHKFIWIGSDSWSGRQLSTFGNEDLVEGAITIQPMSAPIPAFDDYFTSLNPLTYDRDPWFREFWEQHFNCSLPYNNTAAGVRGPSDRPRCPGNLKLGTANNYSQEGQIQFVADSVWAFAHALRDMHRAYCSGDGLCNRMRPVKGQELREFLRNVSFQGVSGNAFQFTPNGNGPVVHYKILNYQQVSPNKYKFVPVGYYKEGLQLNTSAVRYRLMDDKFPKSSCWRPCSHNEMKFKRDGECCWSCLPCEQYEFLQDEFTCTECPNGTKPTDNLTECTNIQERYLQPNTSSAISALVFATIGEFATIFTACIYIRHRDTPVVKASGRELSGLLLVGVFLCYALTYLFLAPPTILTCGLQQFLMGIAFTLCYASLLVKTNRVYRIFTYGKSTTKRPNFISPLSQIVITLILVLVQGFLSVTWLAAVPPDAVRHYPDRGQVQIVCNAFITSTSLLGLAFPLVLLILCTGFAFMTRKIPGHFNEAKCIGFTMYSSCIVWLAMIPIYILTISNIELRIVSMYIAISLCATVCLACLFLPRIYLILIRPERNVRITISSGPRKMKLTGAVYPNSSSNISNHSPYSNIHDQGRNNTL
ncbi:metabotropic glutamate receptor 2-like [Patiria miniata]|uniref:G-protein coupled receptors family 3 profile domain-containing protein n=1 Tax=Patiria miniata TaxID=46514 RepID=A0A914BIS6_PATMI|nr:metabotropic glutamate receptor 2-like [Patiria miniata]